MEQNKQHIIDRFNNNVKGKKYIKNQNNHCGDEGHWLEKNMGIPLNCNNEPDLHGYEQKKDSYKITFGDWGGSQYIYKNKDYGLNRTDFLRMFGSPNPKKNNRYSWSGKIFPKYGDEYNYAGQRMRFLDNDDLVIEYLYKKDTRETKLDFPDKFKSNKNIELAYWKKKKLETHINKKFGVNGFYILKKNKECFYNKICFGKTIDFEFFKKALKEGSIILDSGMYEGNTRNYSQFRANKYLWNKLIIEEY